MYIFKNIYVKFSDLNIHVNMVSVDKKEALCSKTNRLKVVE